MVKTLSIIKFWFIKKRRLQINKEERVPSSKELTVTGDKKWESIKVGFKTGANSASLNAKRLEGNNAKRRTQRANNVIKG